MPSLRIFTPPGFAAAAAVAAMLAAGCNSSSTPAPPTPPPSSGAMYITDFTNNTITVSGESANCSCDPARQISGSNTKLLSPVGIAIANNTIYVGNEASGTVTEYPVSGRGNIAPSFTISGLNAPVGVAADAAGNVYVTNNGANSLQIFAPGSHVPAYNISGAATNLNGPGFVTLDASGDIWVANISGSSVEEFPPITTHPNGNIAPTTIIAGSNTGLTSPQGIAFDPSGRLYVAINTPFLQLDEVYVYQSWTAGSNNLGPVSAICGSATGVNNPTGVAINSLGTVYVVNSQTSVAGYITDFAANNIGNLACTGPFPNATVSGPAMLNPAGIALH